MYMYRNNRRYLVIKSKSLEFKIGLSSLFNRSFCFGNSIMYYSQELKNFDLTISFNSKKIALYNFLI